MLSLIQSRFDSWLQISKVFVEFAEGQKSKLALEEKPEAFLERTCSSDVRKEIQKEI